MSLAHEAVHLLIFLCELLAIVLVLDLVVRADELGGRSQDICHFLLVIFLSGQKEGMAGFLRGLERWRVRWLGQRAVCVPSREQCTDRQRGAAGCPPCSPGAHVLHSVHDFYLRCLASY